MPGPLNRLFLDHPHSVGETYPEHFGVATRFGFSMIAGGFACLVHAIFPTLFERTGSGAVKKLYGQMVERQPDLQAPAHEEPEWRPEYEI